jgi:hypothetical protein
MRVFSSDTVHCLTKKDVQCFGDWHFVKDPVPADKD